MADDDEIVIMKKTKLPPPITEGELSVTVHIISDNPHATAFTKTKKSKTSIVKECSKDLIDHDIYDATKNSKLRKIGTSIIHKLLIDYFGKLTNEVK